MALQTKTTVRRPDGFYAQYDADGTLLAVVEGPGSPPADEFQKALRAIGKLEERYDALNATVESEARNADRLERELKALDIRTAYLAKSIWRLTLTAGAAAVVLATISIVF